jgi:LmbE family N-acetylglucosaminyl deacetylase
MPVDLTPAAGHHRVLAVVAHPDDETFGLGSLLLRSASAGSVTGVCCFTRGEAGSPREGFPPAGPGLGRVREQELRSAAALLGVSRVEVLGYGDSGMEGRLPADCLAAAPPEELAGAVVRTARDFGADVLVTVDAGDGHPDHRAVRAAVEAAATELGLPVYLACLPRELMRRWAEVMQERDPDNVYLALGELGTPADQLDLQLDTTTHLAQRELAIAAHASQHSPFEELPPDLREAFLTREPLVVRPAAGLAAGALRTRRGGRRLRRLAPG